MDKQMMPLTIYNFIEPVPPFVPDNQHMKTKYVNKHTTHI